MVGPPAPLAGGSCPDGAEPTPPSFGASDTSVVLRLTYRQSVAGDLICDAVIPLGHGNPIIAIPQAATDAGIASHVDIFAEYFRDAGGTLELLGSGQRLAVDLESSGTIDIRITYSNECSCAKERSIVSRAFHSATPLPSGEVLILGGAVASSSGSPEVDLDNPGGLLFATDSAEIYDPRTGTFREVSIPGLLPRAMHSAVLLAGEGPEVHIAIVGGLTVAGDPTENPVLASAGDPARLRLVAAAGAVGAPGELLTYDAGALRFTRQPLPDGSIVPARRVFGSASDSCTPGSRPVPVILGGWTNAGMGEAITTFETLDPISSQPVASEATRAERFGASVTDLGEGSALVWGGHLNSAPDGLVQHAGELFLGLDTSSPTSSSLTFTGAVNPGPRAFHTAARTGDGSVLVTGGFLIGSDGRALAPSPVFAQRLVPGSQTEVFDVPVAGGGAGVPAAFLDSVALADGDVMVSGGNPDLGHADCGTDAAGLVCSVPDVLRYRAASTAFERVGSLVVSRYGHALTRLADGTVLITGGLRADGDTLTVLDEAELYDPRELADDPISDLAPDIEREPGDVVRDASGEPAVECSRVETR